MSGTTGGCAGCATTSSSARGRPRPTLDDLRRQLGPKLPEGLWAPWPLRPDGVHAVAVCAERISEAFPRAEAEDRDGEDGEDGAEGEDGGEGEAEEPTPWARRRKVFAEFCCGSRRTANALASHQYHTISFDDDSKGIALECPKQWHDPSKDAKLILIKCGAPPSRTAALSVHTASIRLAHARHTPSEPA